MRQIDKLQKLGWAASLAAVGTQLVMSNAAAQEPVQTSRPSLVVTPQTAMQMSGPQGGPFSPASFQYQVSASIGTVRYYIITPSWLTVSSSSDTADTGGVTIMLTVNPIAAQLPPGTYRPSVAFRNVTNGHGSTTRTAVLIVRGPSPSGLPSAPSFSHPPSAGNVHKGGGPLLDGSGGYLLDDRGDRLLAK